MKIQQEALEALTEYHALRIYNPKAKHPEHYDYGNGFHGTVHIDPHEITKHADRVMTFLYGLVELLGETIIDKTQVVAGPQRGGAKLADWLKGMIEAKKHSSAERVESADIDKKTDVVSFGKPGHVDRTDHFSLTSHYQRIVAGKRVLLIDDVCNTKATLHECYRVITAAGGIVIATCVLYDRVNVQAQYEIPDLPHIPLVEYEDGNLIMKAEECNLCSVGVPIAKF